MKIEYVVKENDNNIMVKDIVKSRLKISSRLYKKIVPYITLNREKCYTTNRVTSGDIVRVDLDYAYDNEKVYDKFKPWQHDINVIYEDDYILCVNKEKGVPCHPSAKHLEKTLYNAVMNYYINKGENIPIHFVNRLDKDTTGVVVIAKHKYVQELLSKQMKDGTMTKKYIAVVYGKLENKEGIIEKNIARKDGSVIIRKVTNNGQGEYAKTGYKVINYNEKENYSILEVLLYTGRTHQIRVHFASIGHPLLGDELYSEEVKINEENVHKYIDRQALHAYEVKFKNINGEEKIIKSDIPNDILTLMT